ncbi:MarR family transcriptional regulator [Streptomyces diastatochromogenes]
MYREPDGPLLWQAATGLQRSRLALGLTEGAGGVHGDVGVVSGGRGRVRGQRRAGAVLAHLRAGGIRASELARASGRHKQVIGSLVDDLERLGYLERKPDPADRRAKLICPTDRGLLQMETAAAIMRTIEERHAKALGRPEHAAFKSALRCVADLQRKAAR